MAKAATKLDEDWGTDLEAYMKKHKLPKKSLLQFAKDDFRDALAAYKKNPKDFFNSWHFLDTHPAFRQLMHLKSFKDPFPTSLFTSDLYIMVVKVDPKTKRIEDDEKRNTLTNIWLEHGPWYSKKELDKITGYNDTAEHGTTTHDIRIDCGGDTYEEAIVNMAKLVMKEYGEKRPAFHSKKKSKKNA